MATGANATPLGKLHPSIGAKRGFDAGPGAGLMAPPGPPVSFPSLQNFQQPQVPNVSFPQAHQFTSAAVTTFSPSVQQPGPGMKPPGGGKAATWIGLGRCYCQSRKGIFVTLAA